MSDKPQEDILDQIITQGLNQMDAPAEPPGSSQQKPYQEEAAPEEAPTPGQDGKTASPAQKRDKRSAVYIYLLILFGAAFMMLLLAYFVQQRSNASTIDELRSSMNLSRGELLEQIETLEKDKESLREEIRRNNDRANQAQTNYQEAEQEVAELKERLQHKANQFHSAVVLALLEQFCAEKDWIMAAVDVEVYDGNFNDRSTRFYNDSLIPAQGARYLELREKVLEQVDYLVLDYDAALERDTLYLDENAKIYSDGTVNIARSLLGTFHCASQDDDSYGVAGSYMMDCYLDGAGLDGLKDRGFQPSTVELFERTMDDLNARGVLEKHEDGTVSFLIGNDQFITFKIDSAEIVQCDLERDELPGWISDIVYGDGNVDDIPAMTDLPDLSDIAEIPAGE